MPGDLCLWFMVAWGLGFRVRCLAGFVSELVGGQPCFKAAGGRSAPTEIPDPHIGPKWQDP